MTSKSDTNPGLLMKGLIYPAFVGAGLVWAFTAMANGLLKAFGLHEVLAALASERPFLALWLLAYFAAAFVLLTNAHDFKRNYNIYTFAANIGDVLIVFFAFYSLGLVDNTAPNLSATYLWLTCIPITAGLGRISVGAHLRVKLSLAFMVITLLMSRWGYALGVLNVIAITMMYLLLGMYFRILLLTQSNPPRS
jgi:hypothetical protein